MGTKSRTLLLTAVNWPMRAPSGHYFRIPRHTPGIRIGEEETEEPDTASKAAAIGVTLMKRIGPALLLLMALSPSKAQDSQLVLLATHRSGGIEIFEPTTLAILASIHVLPQAQGIRSSPDGGLLYVGAGIAPDFEGCCALYALNLMTKKMTSLVAPSGEITVSPDGNYVLTQRGAVGIEIYNGKTLAREEPIPQTAAPGVYHLSFSPDGSLLFGVTNWPKPSLDVFQFADRRLLRRYPVSGDVSLSGTWVRDAFYLYSFNGPTGQLWKVNPATPTLGRPLTVSFPDAAPDCALHEEGTLGAGGQIFLFEMFGSKWDRRVGCRKAILGGVLALDPETGRVLKRIAEDIHFSSLVSSPDGEEIYGVDVRHPNWDSVGLVRLDAATGKTLAKRELTRDVWSISLASMPRKLLPHGTIEIVRD